MAEILKKKIVDALTGEEIWEDLTKDEIAEVMAARKEASEQVAIAEAKATARAAIFEKLGLTEDEAKLLLS